MTINGDTVCSLIQSFPIFLILAQNSNKCVETPLLYKPPTPTQTPEYYAALDALFQTLYSNKPDCQEYGYNHGYGPGKPYYVYANKKPPYYGYPSHSNTHYNYQNGRIKGPEYPCYSYYGNSGHQSYPHYGYKKLNVYNVSGVKYGSKGYASGNQVYNLNNHKYKVVMKRSKGVKRWSQKLQANSCVTSEGGNGACLDMMQCPRYKGKQEIIEVADQTNLAFQERQCPSNDSRVMVCCPDSEMIGEQFIGSEEVTTEQNNYEILEHQETKKNNETEHIQSGEFDKENSFHPDIDSFEVEVNSSSNEEDVEELAKPPHCGVNNSNNTLSFEPNSDNFPWIALLGYATSRGTAWKCGGSVITPRHVLTAAYCIHGNEHVLYMVRLGTVNKRNNDTAPIDVPIASKIVHHRYNKTAYVNDIGILLLKHSIKYTELIRPVCLLISPSIRNLELDKYRPYVAGWKKFGGGSARPRVTRVVVMSVSRCARVYLGKTIDERVLCAGLNRGGRRQCYSDNGGPLSLPVASSEHSIPFFYQIGLVSYGKKCAEAGFPGVYTRVSPFIPWIMQTVRLKV